MPYTINKTNGTILTDLLDNSVDNITTDLSLVGKNTANYGELFNENFIKLLENFANDELQEVQSKVNYGLIRVMIV